jgi:hypothetical protein
VKGYVLQTYELPRDAGAITGRRKANERNTLVLNVLLDAGEPLNVQRLMKLTGFGRAKVEDAVNALKEEGLIHHGPIIYKTGRQWLPIDIPFPPKSDTASSPTKSAKTKEKNRMTKDGLTPTEVAIIRTAREFQETGRSPFTYADIADVTGFHTSTVGVAIAKHPELFKRAGSRNHRKLHSYVGSDVSTPTPAPPPLAAATPAPTNGDGTDTKDRDLLVRLLLAAMSTSGPTYDELYDSVTTALGHNTSSSPGDAARIAELERENAELREKLERAQERVRVLAEI